LPLGALNEIALLLTFLVNELFPLPASDIEALSDLLFRLSRLADNSGFEPDLNLAPRM
jgi:hypothetical protein